MTDRAERWLGYVPYAMGWIACLVYFRVADDVERLWVVLCIGVSFYVIGLTASSVLQRLLKGKDD